MQLDLQMIIHSATFEKETKLGKEGVMWDESESRFYPWLMLPWEFAVNTKHNTCISEDW